MRHRLIHSAILLGLAAVHAIALGRTCRAGGLTIPSGYDLTTFSSISLAGLPVIPLPLQSFDFGPPIGTLDVGNSSYIAHRLSGGTLTAIGDSFQTPVDGLALAFRTKDQVNYSLFDPNASGMGYVYGGFTTPSSTTATETIKLTTATGGTFTADYVTSISLHTGSLNGPTLGNPIPGQFTTVSGTWTSIAPQGALAIPGVNDGFYVTGATYYATGNPSTYFTQIAASVPEPSSLVLAATGVVALMAAAARHTGRIRKI